MKNTPQRRLKEAVKYVSRQWGHGWNRLGPTLQEALVRAELLAEISRLSIGVDTDGHSKLVDEIASVGMQWTPDALGR